MDFKDVAKMVIDAAPGLGAALAPITGGASLGVGVALKALGSVFGLGDDAKPEQIAAAIQGDPDAVFKMKVAEQNFILEMRKADQAELASILADKANARCRDVAIRQTGKPNMRADVMLAGAFISIIVIAAMLALGEIDAASGIGGFLITAGGLLLKDIGTALDFEFGSSRIQMEQGATIAASSARKTELLEQR